MIGRRAAVGLSLLCALMFSALVVQSASAQIGTKSTLTTAFTCVKGGGASDFKDAHCDEFVGKEKGEYGHVEITKDTTTEITVDNTTTGEGKSEPKLKGVLGGINTTITCKTVHGEGFIHNVETGSKVHTVTGTITTKFGGAAGSGDCTVTGPANCKVKEPVEVKSELTGVEGLGPEKTTMGVEFKPTEGKTFVTLEFEGSKCALAGVGKKFPVEGTAIATGKPAPTKENAHTGATSIFEPGNEMETLEIGLKKQEFSLESTVRMKGGNPISLTTVT